MTVYELIQELSQYKADTEVEFHFEGTFTTDVKAEFDRDNEDDEQEVTVDAEFNDNVEFDDIRDHENYRYGKPYIQINFTY